MSIATLEPRAILPRPYYEHAGVTIYHADCRDVLPLVSADVVVTDPPYGVSFSGKSTKHTGSDGVGYSILDDSPGYVSEVVVQVVNDCIRHVGRVVLTPGTRSMFRYPEPNGVGAIFFPSGAGFGRWGFTCSQPIFYYGKDPYLAKGLGMRPDSFSTTVSAEKNGHPCPKPLSVMLWLVNKASLEGECVLDPFMGSGTTLHAAKELGRRAIGIEIEERYCEIAANRLSQEVLAL